MKTHGYLGIFFLLAVSLPACGDKSALEQCVDDCGFLPPLFQEDEYPDLCGSDGFFYHSQCEMDCHGIEPAANTWECSTFPGPACTDDKKGLGMVANLCRTICGEKNKYEEIDIECGSSTPEGLDTCDPCSGNTEDWLCGADGAWYCSACVMDALGVSPAEEGGECHDPVEGKQECDEATESYASLDDACDRCVCRDGRWCCTQFWKCAD